jgi:polysaccharide pyruvyl transferase WcaK-like protein
MNIKVLGWYNHGNVGDEAFKLCFPLLLPSHRVSCVESIRDDDKSDAYILGGGDVVYDAYTSYLKKFAGKPRIAASVTVTPHSSFDDMKMFDKVYVRDDLSMEVARQHVDASLLSYMPDATFMLEPDPVAGREWLVEAYNAAGLELYEKVVVCVISSYVAFNRRESLARDFINFLNLADVISGAADTHGASFVFLPFSTMPPNDDRMSNAFVASRCKFYRKNYVVYQHLDVQTTLNVLSCAQAVISTRLHSSIFSTISGVPFIDLTHHDKNLGFIRTLGRDDWSLPLWDFSVPDFNRMLGSFVDGRVPDPYLADFTAKSRDQLGAIKLYE